MRVYVVEMCRWGSNENHSYCSGVYLTLVKALEEGISHSTFRGRKYEPTIHSMQLESSSEHNRICDGIEQAESLYKELTGKEWKELES